MTPTEKSCEPFEPLLSSHALGELSEAERDRVSAHLAVCPSCREELDLLSRTAALLARTSPADMGLEAKDRQRILAAASQRLAAPKVAWFRRPAAWACAAAALVVVTVTGMLLWNSEQLGREDAVEVASLRKAESPAPVRKPPETDLALARDAKATEVAAALPPGSRAARPAAERAAETGLAAPEAPADLRPRPVSVASSFAPTPDGARARAPAAPSAAARTSGIELKDGGAAPPKGLSLGEVKAGGVAVRPPDLTRNASTDGLRIEMQHERALRAGPDAAKESRPTNAVEESLARTLETTRRRSTAAAGAATRGDAVTDELRRLLAVKESRAGGGAADSIGTRMGGARGANDTGAKDPYAFGGDREVQEVAQESLDPAGRGVKKSATRYMGGSPPARAGRSGAPAEEEAAGEARLLDGSSGAEDPPRKRAAEEESEAEAVRQVARKAEKLTEDQSRPSADPAMPPAAAHQAPAEKGAASTALGSPAPAADAPAIGATAATAGTAGAAAPDRTAEFKARVDEILSRLDRKSGETPDMMFFRYWGDNPFVEASSDPLSTFAVDVDTASYTLTRSYLCKRGILPPREAVRTEEFINYFKSRYAPPAEDGRAFAIHTEMAPDPFAHEEGYQLFKVGLKGREVSKGKRKSCSLVFVVDTSGSMRNENRLELVKDGLRLLVKEMDEGDTIGIVAFDREARVVLDPTPASEQERLLDGIARLEPRQNTNVAAGLQLGFRMAGSSFRKDGVNRVLLLSDGVANTGNVDPATMLESVRGERERGIYLTCVGVGMGNHNDVLMETLADRGNGQCVYVDRIEEARKVFVDNLTGTLEAIAKDVKIQVEFDPARVIRYRLLGYENRAIADSAFRDNTVDAGEVGAGHEVTALYEVKARPGDEGKLATVRVRYLTVDHEEAVEYEKTVAPSEARKSFGEASPAFQLTACVAEFAEVLRASYWARRSSLDRVATLLEGILPLTVAPPDRKLGDDPEVVELAALVRRADALVRRRDQQIDDIASTVDTLKYNYYLQARLEDQLQAPSDARRSELEDLRRQQDQLRRRLEDLLSR